MNNPVTRFDLILAGATGAGAGIAAFGMGDPWGGAHWLWMSVRSLYHLLGMVMMALVPLAVWAVTLVARQCFQRTADRRMELDYGYISRTAPLLGLLGTVSSLALATSYLEGVGSAIGPDTILRIIPRTGQALVATIAGLVIALVAETALHIIERRQSCHVEHV
jgi:hypothetical protein